MSSGESTGAWRKRRSIKKIDCPVIRELFDIKLKESGLWKNVRLVREQRELEGTEKVPSFQVVISKKAEVLAAFTVAW